MTTSIATPSIHTVSRLDRIAVRQRRALVRDWLLWAVLSSELFVTLLAL